MKYNKEDQMRKIRAVLRHEQSAREIGNLEEAQAFSNKLHSLLEKHNLAMSEVENFKEQRENDITSSRKLDQKITVDQKRQYGNWEQRLMSVLCDYNYCKLILVGGKTKNGQRVLIIGTQDNIEIVQYLHSVLSTTILNMGEKYYNKTRLQNRLEVAVYANQKEEAERLVARKMGISSSHLRNNIVKLKNEYAVQHELDNGNVLYSVQEFGSIPDVFSPMTYKPKFVESYLLGACEGIRSKLKEQLKEMEEDVAKKANALVKVNGEALQKYMDKNFNLGKGRASNRKVKGSAFSQGVKDGKKVSVNKGVSAQTGQKALN